MAEEKQQPTYSLSPEETQFFQMANTRVLNAKLKIHDLNVQLEAAQKDRDEGTAQFQTALALLAHSKKMQAPTVISPDFTQITGAKQ